jgi:MFS family permease
MLFVIMAFVLVAYLVVGLAMPVLPLYVHRQLGLGDVAVGFVAGSPFAAALFSRVIAGRFTDRRGSKAAIAVGLVFATAGGLVYIASTAVHAPDASFVVLLLGRAALGVADSFIITGALNWGLALLGGANTGKVMAWVGTSLYAAFAIGAPLGSALYSAFGFSALAAATALIPLATLCALAPMRVPMTGARAPGASILRVARAVWQPGVGVALSGIGFAAILAFVSLFFTDRGWAPVWLAFTLLSASFMFGRLCFGSVPDRVGGAKVAFVCILIEAFGLPVLWLAPSMPSALVGVAITGLGYSLVYPGLGVEALRRAPAANRGLAMGAYTAFLDLSLGISGPLLGLVSVLDGVRSVFVASAVVVLLSAFVPLWLWRSSTEKSSAKSQVLPCVGSAFSGTFKS